MEETGIPENGNGKTWSAALDGAIGGASISEALGNIATM